MNKWIALGAIEKIEIKILGGQPHKVVRINNSEHLVIHRFNLGELIAKYKVHIGHTSKGVTARLAHCDDVVFAGTVEDAVINAIIEQHKGMK